MDADKARAILREIGKGGKLEVVLYRGTRICTNDDDDGIDCTSVGAGMAFRPGASLICRLNEVCDKVSGEAPSFLVDGGSGAPALSEIRVYYVNVHSIYPLVRKPLAVLAAARDRRKEYERDRAILRRGR